MCDEESHFYSQCIDRLLLRAHRDGDTVIEFGSGDGTPVINSLKQVRPVYVSVVPALYIACTQHVHAVYQQLSCTLSGF